MICSMENTLQIGRKMKKYRAILQSGPLFQGCNWPDTQRIRLGSVLKKLQLMPGTFATLHHYQCVKFIMFKLKRMSILSFVALLTGLLHV